MRLIDFDSQCFRLVGYSLPVRECFTLEFVIKKQTSGLTKGTSLESNDLGNEKVIWENGSNSVTRKVIARLSTRQIQSSPTRPYLQSMSKALFFRPIVDMNWSMMPQGTLAKSCSAFWQARAFAFAGMSSEEEEEELTSDSRNVCIATSRLAELRRK